jgi:acyl-CoA synthetase (AMP-forming)/AMP-acid ligase II/aryl carrier-like protein
MTKVKMPSLDFFLEKLEVDDYPSQSDFNQLKESTWVILHTSGSTGIPKPVYVPHGVFASQDAQQLVPFLGGKPTWVDRIRGRRLLVGLPLFHAACLTEIAYSIYCGATIVLPPIGPLSAAVVDSIFTHGNVHGALIAPSLIIDIYKNPEYLANMLQRLEFLSYVGGIIPKAIGDEIASEIEVITMFGATETLSQPMELHDSREDWEYLSYSSFAGHVFRPVGNGLHEMVIVRNPELELFQGVFTTFPKLTEYSTNDLYEPHPTKPGKWRFRMRSDDIICFNNAEKLNPITMEATITSHPKVHSAVIGGHGQFQACLLVEPKVYPRTAAETASFIDDVWLSVVEANKDCPAHGRVMKDFIMLTDPKRPLPRAAKDTVQRSAVFVLYKHEFQAIYDQQSNSDGTTAPASSEPSVNGSNLTVSANGQNGISDSNGHSTQILEPEVSVVENATGQAVIPVTQIESYVEQYVRRILPQMVAAQLHETLGSVMGLMATDLLRQPQQFSNGTGSHEKLSGMSNGTGNHGKPSLKDALNQIIAETTYMSRVTDDANMFECGLDSIQVPELVKSINKTLGGLGFKAGPINPQLVYNNQTVNKLVAALMSREEI